MPKENSLDELQRAIARFEAAASRRRRRPEPETTGRPPQRWGGWQVPAFITVAAVVVGIGAAMFFDVLGRGEPPAARQNERTALAEPAEDAVPSQPAPPPPRSRKFRPSMQSSRG